MRSIQMMVWFCFQQPLGLQTCEWQYSSSALSVSRPWGERRRALLRHNKAHTAQWDPTEFLLFFPAWFWCLWSVFLNTGIFPWPGQSELSYVLLWPEGVWSCCLCAEGPEKSSALLSTHVCRVLGGGNTAAGQRFRFCWFVLLPNLNGWTTRCCMFLFRQLQVMLYMNETHTHTHYQKHYIWKAAMG